MLSGEGRLLNDQSDGTTLTAGIIVLLIGLALYRLSDAVAAKEERRKSRYAGSAQPCPQCGVPAGSGARGMSAKTKSPPVQRTPASLQGDSFEPTITRSLTRNRRKHK